MKYPCSITGENMNFNPIGDCDGNGIYGHWFTWPFEWVIEYDSYPMSNLIGKRRCSNFNGDGKIDFTCGDGTPPPRTTKDPCKYYNYCTITHRLWLKIDESLFVKVFFQVVLHI